MDSSNRYAGVGAVFVGGMLGTLLRFLASQTPGVLNIFVVNVVGAFLLAVVVGWITGSGALTRTKLRFRLFLGTGLMGGFTTYSTLAFQTAALAAEGAWMRTLTYALGTVVVGAVASVIGLLVGRFCALHAGRRTKGHV